jgi:hypothetical protein
MRVHHVMLVLVSVVALALTPVCSAAEDASAEAAVESSAVESTCSITVLCNCVDEEISCSGPTGTCFSGGTSCDEWVQCGSGAREYCPDPPTGCGSRPSCTKAYQCNDYCSPDMGLCLNGCCIC